jgi:hypothetical protein
MAEREEYGALSDIAPDGTKYIFYNRHNPPERVVEQVANRLAALLTDIPYEKNTSILGMSPIGVFVLHNIIAMIDEMEEGEADV